MRRYIVTVADWEPEIFEAETASGAKAKAFRALREIVGARITFRDFLGRVSVRREHTVH